MQKLPTTRNLDALTPNVAYSFQYPADDWFSVYIDFQDKLYILVSEEKLRVQNLEVVRYSLYGLKSGRAKSKAREYSIADMDHIGSILNQEHDITEGQRFIIQLQNLLPSTKNVTRSNTKLSLVIATFFGMLELKNFSGQPFTSNMEVTVYARSNQDTSVSILPLQTVGLNVGEAQVWYQTQQTLFFDNLQLEMDHVPTEDHTLDLEQANLWETFKDNYTVYTQMMQTTLRSANEFEISLVESMRTIQGQARMLVENNPQMTLDIHVTSIRWMIRTIAGLRSRMIEWLRLYVAFNNWFVYYVEANNRLVHRYLPRIYAGYSNTIVGLQSHIQQKKDTLYEYFGRAYAYLISLRTNVSEIINFQEQRFGPGTNAEQLATYQGLWRPISESYSNYVNAIAIWRETREAVGEGYFELGTVMMEVSKRTRGRERTSERLTDVVLTIEPNVEAIIGAFGDEDTTPTQRAAIFQTARRPVIPEPPRQARFRPAGPLPSVRAPGARARVVAPPGARARVVAPPEPRAPPPPTQGDDNSDIGVL